MKLLFLAKREDSRAEAALEWLIRQPDLEVLAVWGRRGEPLPNDVGQWEGDYLLSYLSPWVVPESVLLKASTFAINFHPGPPEYPGIGCTNFALYDEVSEFGVTCHHMKRIPDTGAIIAVKRFSVVPDDTVSSLTERCYEAIALLFREIWSVVALGKQLPVSGEQWRRRPLLRRELNALCEIRREMPGSEIRRRVRAVTFQGMPGAWLTVDGIRFHLTLAGEK